MKSQDYSHLLFKESKEKLREKYEELIKAYEKVEEYLKDLEKIAFEKAIQLIKAKEELIHSERLASIGNLTAILIHGIYNPLSVINGTIPHIETSLNNVISFLLKDNIDKEVINEELNKSLARVLRIKKAGEKIFELVEHLKKFSQFKKEDFELTDINTILEDTINWLRYDPKNERINFILNFDKLTSIYCNSGQLRLAFLNILINSISSVNFEGKVKITTYQKNQKIVITFEDTGIGISEDNIPHIFEPFFTTKNEGIGLGLTITKKFIENHNGIIKVESKENIGTKIIIEIPLIHPK